MNFDQFKPKKSIIGITASALGALHMSSFCMHHFARIPSVTCVHILEFQEKRGSVFASASHATGGRSKPKAHIHNKLMIIEYYIRFPCRKTMPLHYLLICSTLFVRRLAIGGHLAVFICSLFHPTHTHGSRSLISI